VAFKIRQNPFSAGALPRGPRWGSSRRSPRPPSRLERGHPSPYPTALGTDPPSALAIRPPRSPARSTPMFKSYLSSRSFRVKCNNFSSWHICICGVPQGSVLGPLLFILYTTPLSTLISSLSLTHHLYADDTQLFFSFYPSVFDSSITQLQRSLQKISSWMTANLLTLSSSNTEFLLVGLPQQLAKINTSSLYTDSARNLGFIIDERLTFSDQINICCL